MKDRFYLRYVYNNKIYDIFAVDFFNKTAQLTNLDRAETLLTKIDTDKLLQCTGLRDNTDKLIFEGDIVKFSSIYGYGIFEIKWSDEFAMFGYEDAETDFTDLRDCIENGAYIEIIGNIYENPELLGVDNVNI